MPVPAEHGLDLFSQAESSSVRPSQSSSSPLQTSLPEADGTASHAVAAAGFAELHLKTPGAVQTPDPAVHGLPLFDHDAPSSVAPSQSLSRPSQTSVPAAFAWAVHCVGPAGAAVLHA